VSEIKGDNMESENGMSIIVTCDDDPGRAYRFAMKAAINPDIMRLLRKMNEIGMEKQTLGIFRQYLGKIVDPVLDFLAEHLLKPSPDNIFSQAKN
jgi:hypothetical protein